MRLPLASFWNGSFSCKLWWERFSRFFYFIRHIFVACLPWFNYILSLAVHRRLVDQIVFRHSPNGFWIHHILVWSLKSNWIDINLMTIKYGVVCSNLLIQIKKHFFLSSQYNFEHGNYLARCWNKGIEIALYRL